MIRCEVGGRGSLLCDWADLVDLSEVGFEKLRSTVAANALQALAGSRFCLNLAGVKFSSIDHL